MLFTAVLSCELLFCGGVDVKSVIRDCRYGSDVRLLVVFNVRLSVSWVFVFVVMMMLVAAFVLVPVMVSHYPAL